MSNWEHQDRGKAQIAKLRSDGIKSILGVAPPGAGKSRVMMQLTTEEVAKGGSVRLYVHRSMLREQLCGLFEAQGIPYGVQASGCKPDFDQPIQICMLDTVWSRCVKRAGRSDWTLGEPSLVIVDEAHNQMGDKAEGVFVGSNAKSDGLWDGHLRKGSTLLGFTATPVGCSGIYKKLVQFGSYSELRRASAHLPIRCYAPTEMDLRGLSRTSNYEFSSSQLTERAYAILGDAFEWWSRLNPDAEPAILFAPSVESSRWFATEWCKRGVPAAHIDGETTMLPRNCPLGGGWYLEQYDTNEPGIRDEVLAMSKSGELKVVCNRFVLREAIDMPWLRHGILATAFGGISTYLQSVGRFQRHFAGHPFKIMQDHGGNYYRHGSPNMERHWDLRDTNESIAKSRQEAVAKAANAEEVEGICCPKCFCWRREGVRCLNCGHSHKRSVRTVRMVDGELRLQTGSVHKKKTKKQQDCQSIWSGVLFGSAKTDRSVSSAVTIWQARCRQAGVFPDPTMLRSPPPDKTSPAYDLPVTKVYPWTVRRKGDS
jgi:superfamily II DNA or RNA helicase